MKENTQEKNLIEVNDNNIFYKIKTFIKSLFVKNSNIENNVEIKEDIVKSDFLQSIKNIEDEETELLKLQNRYHNGEISEDELTEEQVKALCAIYKKQIANLKKSNEIRKRKILEYRKKAHMEN